ncbi:catechol O-methyltransferase [Exophiala aquamarina CBS 119918]|uniref:catechol O-methyltransferase n=1 Tax=Exophiala aquamarina CBS 119918 TaxID=1182545 RepID=A0A072NWV3_9EURO|nr:catechol O-methyltransferase [Exophiala aquamarina CBS 119918]KEF51523.1 catechol O-methyltransferase [Exophiala aquamarina CBS 119918]
MADFDPSKKYQEQEETFFDDGREIDLLHFVYNKPDVGEIRGSPAKVLAAIDEYARNQRYLMNVGEDKGRIVADLIAKVKPKVMVELGGYVGYSCILFGEAVRKAGGERYLSLERNPEFAAVIASLVDLAGLSDTVKVIVGSSDTSIKRLYENGSLSRIDLMFLDHYKPAYTTDLKLCEELKLITPGTVLAADNVIKPGNPPYLEYVRSNVTQKKTAVKTAESVNGVDTRFADRTAKQYLQREGEAKLDEARKGDPYLVYESQLINSFEPSGVPVRADPRILAGPRLTVSQDGIEITRCVGRVEVL